jgi:hypothetical protein
MIRIIVYSDVYLLTENTLACVSLTQPTWNGAGSMLIHCDIALRSWTMKGRVTRKLTELKPQPYYLNHWPNWNGLLPQTTKSNGMVVKEKKASWTRLWLTKWNRIIIKILQPHERGAPWTGLDSERWYYLTEIETFIWKGSEPSDRALADPPTMIGRILNPYDRKGSPLTGRWGLPQ